MFYHVLLLVSTPLHLFFIRPLLSLHSDCLSVVVDESLVTDYLQSVGKTLVNRTTGLKNANDSLKGRIFEVSLADLQSDEEHAFRKVKLRVDEVQGKNCLTNFHGLDFTTDKLRSLVRKWQTLIEANVTVKTTDDYLVRLFAIAFIS